MISYMYTCHDIVCLTHVIYYKIEKGSEFYDEKPHEESRAIMTPQFVDFEYSVVEK